jgi:hypothetical protein
MSNKLEEIAIANRNSLVAGNTYNSSDQSQNYTATHNNALGDGDVKGKGTGVHLDTYNGGGDIDINGSADAAGSGRLQNKSFNQYNEDNSYDHPDTSGNVGQIVL